MPYEVNYFSLHNLFLGTLSYTSVKGDKHSKDNYHLIITSQLSAKA